MSDLAARVLAAIEETEHIAQAALDAEGWLPEGTRFEWAPTDDTRERQ